MTNGHRIVLNVTGLTKSYRAAGEEVAVLRGVNLAVAAGESVALTGESGSGKSTLLHLIAGLDAGDGGEIRLDDAVISKRHPDMLQPLTSGTFMARPNHTRGNMPTALSRPKPL